MNKRLEELKELVSYHKKLYEDGVPEITDSEYDSLYFELETLLEEEGETIDNSPIAEITAPTTSSLKKVKHKDFVGSLSKVKTEDKLAGFFDTVRDEYRKKGLSKATVLAQVKCDGLTIVAEYKNGYLNQALTRGSGDVGEDVTEAVKLVTGIPIVISYKGDLRVRFEAMIPSDKFEEINKENNFSNARNLVAGTIRQTKDMSLITSRGVFGVVFDMLYCEMKFKTISETMNWLRIQGFNIVESVPMNAYEKKDKQYFDYYMGTYNKTVRPSLSYKIDGIVFKIDDIEICNEMGTRFNNPRWAIALKFPSQDSTSILRKVEWNVGRTGRVSPVGIFDEVEIDSVKIERATLHNPDYISAKNLHIGDTIVVARSNDVIPAITASVKHPEEAESVVTPKICPSCGSELELVGANLYCPNSLCKEQVVRGIISWCEKSRANIEGLSENRVRQLYDAGFVKSIADIYSIPDNWEEISKLPRFGFTMLEKLIYSIEESRNIELHKFIYGLGIPGVGNATAEEIAKNFKSIDNVLIPVKLGKIKDFEESLAKINGVGDVLIEEIITFLKNNLSEIEKLISIVSVSEIEDTVSSGMVFSGKKFVFTGTLSSPRHVFESLVISNGGTVSGSVTKNTDYVVIGTNPGSKETKAKKLGIRIITENELKNMLI